MNTGLDQNEPELGIAVLAVALKMLANGNGLLDQEVQVLGQLGSESLLLEDAQHLVASDETDLGNTVRVSQNDTWWQKERKRLMT